MLLSGIIQVKKVQTTYIVPVKSLDTYSFKAIFFFTLLNNTEDSTLMTTLYTIGNILSSFLHPYHVRKTQKRYYVTVLSFDLSKCIPPKMGNSCFEVLQHLTDNMSINPQSIKKKEHPHPATCSSYLLPFDFCFILLAYFLRETCRALVRSQRREKDVSPCISLSKHECRMS